MSYRTNWKLDGEYICGENKRLSKLDRVEINEYIEENREMRLALSEGLGKWGASDRGFIDKDYQMCNFSKQFPQILFTLKYEMIDDSRDSLYTEYWLNGEVQREKLKYITPKFDTNKLREYC